MRVILADTRQQEFTQNGGAHKINFLVGTFLVEQSSSRMTGSFSISVLKASWPLTLAKKKRCYA